MYRSYFFSLKGVSNVEQGWIAADGDDSAFSEAVIIVFDAKVTGLQTLIAVHLHTHSCTASHSMRGKYRSAVYTFNAGQAAVVQSILHTLQSGFELPIITKVIPYKRFRPNENHYLDYYYSNPDKPFCKNIINPKLRLLMDRFAKDVDTNKLSHLQIQSIN